MNSWIVVANRTTAKLFKTKPLRLVETLENELAQEKNRTMTTDKPHEDAALQFARHVAHHLGRKFAPVKPGDLLIVSEPRMKGYLREFMEPKFHKNLEWIAKDLVHLTSHELEMYFSRQLGWPAPRRASMSALL